MIKTVLVPVDGSPAAETGLSYMELIASRIGAALHLVSTLERGDEDPALGETITYLEGMADRLRSQSLSCSREVSSDEAADEDADIMKVEAAAVLGHQFVRIWGVRDRFRPYRLPCEVIMDAVETGVMTDARPILHSRRGSPVAAV